MYMPTRVPALRYIHVNVPAYIHRRNGLDGLYHSPTNHEHVH